MGDRGVWLSAFDAISPRSASSARSARKWEGKSIKDGLVGLLERYEVRHLKQKGHELRIPIVPVGIEYDRKGKGLEQSAVGKWISKWIPFAPNWTIPAVRTKIIVRFGTPHYFEGQSPREMTEIVMKEAAILSNIPYEVGS